MAMNFEDRLDMMADHNQMIYTSKADKIHDRAGHVRSTQLRYTVERATRYWEFWDQIIKWLEKEMGPINQNWTYEWDHNKYYFYFEREEDKVKFILRWL